jgi:hypothetical protein
MSPVREEVHDLFREVREELARREQERVEHENEQRRAERPAAPRSLLDSRGLML